MGQLFLSIRRLVGVSRYVIGQHAAERLDERGIMDWQIVEGLADAVLITERPHTIPSPTIEVRQWLADGLPVKVIWGHLIAIDAAKLITVHFFDEVKDEN